MAKLSISLATYVEKYVTTDEELQKEQKAIKGGTSAEPRGAGGHGPPTVIFHIAKIVF